jgi:O-antigen/teichoic acid export membrane protein
MTNDPIHHRISLKGRVLGAGFWSIAGFALTYAIRLGSSLLMTRLLVPQVFGVMAIATMVMVGLAMFSDFGLQPNIVQSRRGSDPAYLNTAWTIQIIRGLLLWLIALCISLLVFAANHVGFLPKASAYADPFLPRVIAVVSVTVAILGFQSTKLFEASRNLWLGRVTLIQLAAHVIGLICMIGWACIDPSIWALVAGNICSAATTTLLSHIWLPGVANRWHWEGSAVHEIIYFGKWIFLSSILFFVANNADRMLLGVYVDSATLGIYSIAFTIFSAIAQILNTIFSQVSFPALSEVVRERALELKRSLYRFHVLTATLTYLCAGGLIASGDTLIRLLYDPRYQQAGWILEVLSVALISVPFNLGQLGFLARGLPRVFTHVIAIRVAVTLVLIPLGFHFFGFPGAVWAIAVSQLMGTPAVIYYQVKYDLFDLARELFLFPALLVGMLLGKGLTLLVRHMF